MTDQESTSVSIYLAKDRFYDWATFAPVTGTGSATVRTNVSYTEMPLHIKGGAILPLRAASANTTTELRLQPFQIVIAPGTDGKASGQLYLDDGISITQSSPSTLIKFAYAHGVLLASGAFHAKSNSVSKVTLLDVTSQPRSVRVNGKSVKTSAIVYDKTNKVATVAVSIPLSSGFLVQYE